MTSKISFFNKGIFRSTIKRYWPAWALYIVVWLLAMPINVLANISGNGEYTAVNFIYQIEDMCEEVSVIMTFVFAIIVAMGVFSFMYKSRETSMIASLPVRREAVFCSAFLSGLIPVAVINAVIGILSLLAIIGSITGDCVNAVLIWYGSFMLEFITFFGIASLIATITGSLIALPIFYGIFNFLAVGIEVLIRSTIDIFVYGVDIWNGTVTDFLSPVIYLIDKTTVYTENSTAVYNDITGKVCPILRFDSWTTLVIYAIVGIILAACGLLLYRNRKMECTGDVVAVPKLKPVFKYGVSICAAICFGLLMYLIFWDSYSNSVLGFGGFIALMLFMAVGGAIGYFGADMLNKKSAHVFRNNWGGYLAVVIVCVALCAACRFDLFGIGTYVPDAHDVKSVRVSGSFSLVDITDEEQIGNVIALHESITASLDEIAKDGSDMHTPFYEEEFYDVYIRYNLKNGREVCREYQLSGKRPEAQQYRELMESKAMLEARLAQFENFTEDNVINASLSYCVNRAEWYNCDLTPAQAIDLYKNAITLDIIEGNMDFNSYVTVDEYASQIWIEFCNDPDFSANAVDTFSAYLEFSSFIDNDCVHTIQWFKDNLGVDLGDIIHEPIVNESIIESVEIIG